MATPPNCPHCGQPLEPTRGGRFWYCPRCQRFFPADDSSKNKQSERDIETLVALEVERMLGRFDAELMEALSEDLGVSAPEQRSAAARKAARAKAEKRKLKK
jgi:uncharacterized Zn finger protein (UPF0148 family)